MSTQKFNRGDLVHVAKNLGESMRHFTADVDAIVLYTHAERYGGADTTSYSVFVKSSGPVSWYYGEQLTLIEKNRGDLLLVWEAEHEAEVKEKSDIDWIFTHGPEVLAKPHGASIARLGKDVGIDDLWGSHGEGITYYGNAQAVLAVAQPFLAANDRGGWARFCRAVALPVRAKEPISMPRMIADYEEVLTDHRRLVRELDALLNGAGAARQAALCDIVAQLGGVQRRSPGQFRRMQEAIKAGAVSEKVPIEFKDHEEWLDYCRQQPEWSGPYVINGQAHLTQFTERGKGTRAIWNDEHRRGYILP